MTRHTRTRPARRAAGAALAAALVLAACGGGDDTPADADPADDQEQETDDGQEPEEPEETETDDGDAEETPGASGDDAVLDEMYQAAIDAGETSVTIYGPGEGAKQAVWDLWAETFPEISVELVSVGGGELQARLEQEHATGQHVADIVSIGDSSMMNFHNAGFFASYAPPLMPEDLPEEFQGPDDAFHAVTCQAYGILYNTDALSADEAPLGYHDLVERDFGDMVLGDPREPGGTAYILHRMALDPDFGMPWVEQFGEVATVLEGVEEQEIGARIARGEYDVMALFPGHQVPAEGPVEFVFPTEGGSHINCHFQGIIGDAPNPNAARLLKNWMWQEGPQTAGRDAGVFFPTRPGLGDGPNGLPPIEDIERVRPLSFDEVTGQAEYREQFIDIFG